MKRTIVLVLIYFGFQVLFSIPAVIIIAVNTMKNGQADTSLTNTAIALALLLSSLLMTWFLWKYKYVTNEGSNFKLPSLKLTLLTLCLTFGLIVVLDWLGDLFPLPDMMKDVFQGMSTNVWGIIAICLVGPVLEELLFRGAIQGHMLKIYKKPSSAILLSALVFGVIHGNPAQIPFAFLIGLVMGLLYYRTGSLIPGIIIHVVNNSISTLLTATNPDVTSLFDIVGTTNGYIMLIASLIIAGGSWYMISKMYPGRKVEENVNISGIV